MRMKMRAAYVAMIAVVLGSVPLAAQSRQPLDLARVGSDPHWKVVGRKTSIANVKGKQALTVSEGPGMGVIWLDGLDFANGVIEVDMLGRSKPVQGSFVGVAFHVADAQHHEAVYFRPFNFRAADSAAHAHAVQYVSDPAWPWQRLRSEHAGKYEQAVVPEVDGDEWFHVRIVVARPNVQVFVNNATTPTLSVGELGELAHGSVGLWVGEGSGGSFANLVVTRSP
jgi:hypothetical protein